MDFQLTDEQVLLRDTTRNLLSRSYDQDSRNKIADTELGFSRDVWNQLAEIGILGLGFDEEAGGQIEVMVVMTEIGRHLAPEPVVHAALGPGNLIADSGSDDQRSILDEVAAGQKLLAFAHDGVTTAARQGDSWTLTGRKNPVLAGDSADTLVVSATETVRVTRDQIEEMRPGTVSVMPAGLDKQLTPQDLADLVAFLSHAK